MDVGARGGGRGKKKGGGTAPEQGGAAIKGPRHPRRWRGRPHPADRLPPCPREEVVDEEVDDEYDAPVELVVGRLIEREASGYAELDPAVHVDEARCDEDFRPPLFFAVHTVLEVELGVADEVV